MRANSSNQYGRCRLAWPLLTHHHTHTCLIGGWTGLANAHTLPQVSMHVMAGVDWPGQYSHIITPMDTKCQFGTGMESPGQCSQLHIATSMLVMAGAGWPGQY